MSSKDRKLKQDKRDTGELVFPFSIVRASIIIFCLCALFLVAIGKAYQLQVVRAAELTARAESQLRGSVVIPARRGAIYDRNNTELAVSVTAESVFARPLQIDSARDYARALSPILGRSEASLLSDLNRETGFRWLSRRVSPQVASRVRDLQFDGIETASEWQRYYPLRHRAGHLLGFIGDEGDGLEGIERIYNELLLGGAMEVSGLRDAMGREILTEQAPTLDDLEGSSILLTIDTRIQHVVEREIERAVVQHQARTGAAIVMDPHTGEILAMTNWPLFDPNVFRSSQASDWRNRAVADMWEPGSTFKVFTYAAALETGVLGPDTMLDCGNGRIQIGRYRIRDTHRNEELAAWQVIEQSSNIGTYRMAAMTGEEQLYHYIQEFGFGQRTGIGLGGESAGQLESLPWAEVELANRAFGQGVSVTPLQMALAYSAIANGGDLMAPMLLREIHNKEGEVISAFEPTVVRNVISERTALQVTEAMVAVTGEEGTAQAAALSGIRVAGKTGTAQKVDPEIGTYGDNYLASFIGFVPADDPQFTIVVMIDEPQEGYYGGEVAAPAFARIAEHALSTRGIFVDREPVEIAPEAVAETGAVEETGAVVSLEQAEGHSSLEGVDALIGETGRMIVPDFSGMNLREALFSLEQADLQLEAHSWGVVEHQWPPVSAQVLPGSQIDLYFRSPYNSRMAGFQNETSEGGE